MRILIVGSANNWNGNPAPFVVEQADSIIKLGHEIIFFNIKGKGWKSYLRYIFLLKEHLKTQYYDIIHAHFVWSGLISVLQRKVPVVITFHGSDLNDRWLRHISRWLVYPLAKRCIVVNSKMLNFLPNSKTKLVPCGTDTELFIPGNKTDARQRLGLGKDDNYLLFSSRFDRPEKYASLAQQTVAALKFKAELLEFTGYSREHSSLLYSAVDLLLMTSKHEGSPQVIKEALACNCPIISTDVGDVRALIGNTENCFICGFNAEEIKSRIEQVVMNEQRSNGRERLLQLGLSLPEIALKIESIYLESCIIKY
jgi:teichuronic acid biosynthesis glycosyltransferase TuaC